jgi:hypothetical protein
MLYYATIQVYIKIMLSLSKLCFTYFDDKTNNVHSVIDGCGEGEGGGGCTVGNYEPPFELKIG